VIINFHGMEEQLRRDLYLEKCNTSGVSYRLAVYIIHLSWIQRMSSGFLTTIIQLLVNENRWLML